jgi:hypothetical protein
MPISTGTSLAVIAGIIVVTAGASLLWPRVEEVTGED